MTIVLPAPCWRGTRSAAIACVIVQWNAAARCTVKLTNGPVAVAVARNSPGVNAAATSFAMTGGALPSRFAAGNSPTAKSPSSGRGGASTLSSAAGTPVVPATTSRAASANGFGMARFYSMSFRAVELTGSDAACYQSRRGEQPADEQDHSG